MGAEFAGGAAVMRHFWWEDGFYWINPFSNVDEREPYLIDDAWHAWATSFHQDIQYRLLRRYFRVESPYPSMALTTAAWFGVEIADAMEKHDRWGFSVDDMLGNVSGVLYWYVRHRYPRLPVYFRSGFRQWDRAWDYLTATPYYFIDKKEVARRGGVFQYHISKVELIGRFYRDAYAGIALSKKDLPSKEDVWGLTLGWDNLAWANRLKEGSWNGFLDFLGRHFALSVSATYWMAELPRGGRVSLF